MNLAAVVQSRNCFMNVYLKVKNGSLLLTLLLALLLIILLLPFALLLFLCHAAPPYERENTLIPNPRMEISGWYFHPDEFRVFSEPPNWRLVLNVEESCHLFFTRHMPESLDCLFRFVRNHFYFGLF